MGYKLCKIVYLVSLLFFYWIPWPFCCYIVTQFFFIDTCYSCMVNEFFLFLSLIRIISKSGLLVAKRCCQNKIELVPNDSRHIGIVDCSPLCRNFTNHTASHWGFQLSTFFAPARLELPKRNGCILTFDVWYVIFWMGTLPLPCVCNSAVL